MRDNSVCVILLCLVYESYHTISPLCIVCHANRLSRLPTSSPSPASARNSLGTCSPEQIPSMPPVPERLGTASWSRFSSLAEQSHPVGIRPLLPAFAQDRIRRLSQDRSAPLQRGQRQPQSGLAERISISKY